MLGRVVGRVPGDIVPTVGVAFTRGEGRGSPPRSRRGLVGACVDRETCTNFKVGGRGAIKFAGGVQGSQEEARVEEDFPTMGQGGAIDGKRCLVEDELSEVGEGGCGSDVYEKPSAVGANEHLGKARYLGVGGGLGLRGPRVGFGEVVETEGLVALVEVVEGGGRGGRWETEGTR